MEEIINSCRKAIEEENLYGALFIALALPDICASLDYGLTSSSRYAAWFDENLTQYKGYLSGSDCYALRCSLLHQGRDDISAQRMQDVLDHYIFLTSGSHKNVFEDIEIGGSHESFLQLNAKKFCEDVCNAVDDWLDEKQDDTNIQSRIQETIEIHEPGYVHKNVIKFN